MKARANIYALAYVLNDGIIEFHRVPEKDIDDQVKEALNAG